MAKVRGEGDGRVERRWLWVERHVEAVLSAANGPTDGVATFEESGEDVGG